MQVRHGAQIMQTFAIIWGFAYTRFSTHISKSTQNKKKSSIGETLCNECYGNSYNRGSTKMLRVQGFHSNSEYLLGFLFFSQKSRVYSIIKPVKQV